MIPKYRAWTEEGQVMYYNVYPFRDNTLLLSYDDIAYDEVPADEFILMQSTGLFDKSGVEIFEDDVIRVCDEANHKVKFIRGAFCIDFPKNGTPLIFYGENQYEVIGNIYENPELVEGRNEP